MLQSDRDSHRLCHQTHDHRHSCRYARSLRVAGSFLQILALILLANKTTQHVLHNVHHRRATMPNTTDAETLWVSVQNQIPGGVVGALIILIVGWVIARLLQAGVTAALRRTGLDRRLAPAISNDPAATAAPGDTAQVIGRIVFWLVMVFVLIAVLDALGLELVTAPLTGLLAGIFEFLPRLFAAILI